MSVSDPKALAEKIFLIFDGYLDGICDEDDSKQLMTNIESLLRESMEEHGANEYAKGALEQQTECKKHGFKRGQAAAYAEAAKIAEENKRDWEKTVTDIRSRALELGK